VKVLLSWLRDFAPFDAPTDRIAHDLSMLGMTVEEEVHLGRGLDGIVVARVQELRRHPDAEKIQRVVVDAGAGDPVEVWCGAFNMAVGDLVPLATVGTTMPGGMEIGRRKILGEYSHGMLCSPAELELSADADGILVLAPGSAEPGTPIAAALGLEADVLWDLEVNPNRPDAMSVAGVARDLAARHRVPFALPEPAPAASGEPAAASAWVEVLDAELCPRFTAAVIRGVAPGPTDAAVARRLTLLGMRPISRIVDVSNYVMLELGQPSHPYDLATLPGGGIRVRRAVEGEQLVTLDDIERRLSAEDLLICDGRDHPIGIAGVMGGASTEISAATEDVLVEMACFAPMAIARTARRLGLRSEASARFEKGTDPEVIELAQSRFAELLATGAPAPGLVDTRPHRDPPVPVRLRTDRLNRLLGTALTAKEICGCLEPIGFACTATPAADGGEADTDVEIPSWRPDTTVEVDLIEEVARHWGYDRIGAAVPPSAHFGHLTPVQEARRRIRAALVGLGLSEAMPMSFLAPGDLARAGLADDGIRIANPLVAEESVLRTSLLPGLLKVVAHNVGHRQRGIALFELGHVFRRPAAADAELPDEREHLAVAVVGEEAPGAVDRWWALAEHLRLGTRLEASVHPGLHPTRTATVLVDGTPVGAVGEVDPGVLDAFGIDERVAWFEVDLGAILAMPAPDRPFVPFSRMPSSDVDLAFEAPDHVPAAAVLDALRAAGDHLLVSVEPFDVYRGAGVPEGHRSLAFRVRFQAADRTLTDAEVGGARGRLIEAVQAALPVRLRGE
jgi:phenylalanyl-tRNA synthetase beta chain